MMAEKCVISFVVGYIAVQSIISLVVAVTSGSKAVRDLCLLDNVVARRDVGEFEECLCDERVRLRGS